MHNRHGFSLIRLIVFIASGAIVVVMLFIALDPAKLISAYRNAQRTKDVMQIMQAVQSYIAANGSLPHGIDADFKSVQIIGKNPGACSVVTCRRQMLPQSNCTIQDLDVSLQPYLARMPMDPKTGSESDTRYFINQDTYHAITVGTCDAESEDSRAGQLRPIIEVTQ